MPQPAETTPRQRTPRTDPDLLDGDSGHGNPGEPAGDQRELDTDTDTGSLSGQADPADAGDDELTESDLEAALGPDDDEDEGDEDGDEDDDGDDSDAGGFDDGLDDDDEDAAASEVAADAEPDDEEVDDDTSDAEPDEDAEADDDAAEPTARADDPGDEEEEDDEDEDAEDAEDAAEATAHSRPAALPSAGTPPAATGDRPVQVAGTQAAARTPHHPPTPPSHVGEFPIRGYDKLTVPEVIRFAGRLEPRQLNTVLEFERSNRNRKTLVTRLQRMANKNARPT